MTSKLLTYATLRDANACRSDRIWFKTLFGDSVDVTVDLCVKHASDFDFRWAEILLSPLAQKDYERTKASARADYDCTRASTRANYDRTRAPAWANYERTKASAWAVAYIKG